MGFQVEGLEGGVRGVDRCHVGSRLASKRLRI